MSVIKLDFYQWRKLESLAADTGVRDVGGLVRALNLFSDKFLLNSFVRNKNKREKTRQDVGSSRKK